MKVEVLSLFPHPTSNPSFNCLFTGRVGLQFTAKWQNSVYIYSTWRVIVPLTDKFNSTWFGIFGVQNALGVSYVRNDYKLFDMDLLEATKKNNLHSSKQFVIHY